MQMVPIFKCWQLIQKDLQTTMRPNKTCLLAELELDLQWNPTLDFYRKGGQGPEEVKLLVEGPRAVLGRESEISQARHLPPAFEST